MIVYLYDSNGKEYLDFNAGIAVNSLGHCDKGWINALTDQASKLIHTSNLYHTIPQLELSQRLIELTPTMDKVYLCNSGCEANEAALKFARRYAAHIEGTPVAEKKTKIIALEKGFHGRTMGALSVTYKPAIREPFAPLIPNVEFIPLGDSEALEKAMGDDVCAVILEPVLGEGGVDYHSTDFYRDVQKLCNRHEAVFISDEVQCGLGRLGELWAHGYFDFEPDIVTAAKPLASGLPIGVTMMKDKINAALKPGDHGSTFGGNPLVSSVALHTLNRIAEPAFLKHVTEVGWYMLSTFALMMRDDVPDKIKGIRYPSGLMLALQLNVPVRDVIEECAKEGLLVISAGSENDLRIVPPLIVTKEDVDKAGDIIRKVLQQM
jgi:predicted acetylornithine/succinylornithine family transaminase